MTTNWNFDSTDENSILKKITNSPIKFLDLFEGIYQGLITLGDDKFMLEGRFESDCFIGFSKELKDYVKLESAIMRPVLKGENIRRYKSPQNTLYVIYPHMVNEKGKTVPFEEEYFRQKYPKAYNYLSLFKEELTCKKVKYKTNSKYWFSLHRPREIKLFDSNKILTPQLQNNSNFTIDDKCMYPDAGGYMLIPKDKKATLYYLAVLNSKLFYYFIKNTSTAFNNDYYYFKTAYIQPFNFRVATIKEQEELINHVKMIQRKLQENEKADISLLENTINTIVYKIYDLSEEEIRIIESNLS